MSMRFLTRNGRDMVEFKFVYIIHRNLSGIVGEYNKSGNRCFSIVLTNEEAEELAARGFNVRTRPARENIDELFCFLPCFVNYEHLPPKIYRVTGKKMMLLGENNVGTLDSSDILNVNVLVNARYWDVNGSRGIKAYVNTMYVETEEDIFADLYSDCELVGG